MQGNVFRQRHRQVEAKGQVAVALGETVDPVSYTHLDVYKRQGLAAELIGVLHAHTDEEVAAAELTVDIGCLLYTSRQ